MTNNWNICRTFATKMPIIMYTKKKSMFQRVGILPLLMTFVALLLTSCISDDDTTTVENNSCYVSSVSFSSFRLNYTVKASDGVTDSTYYSTYAASSRVFTIDHHTLTIENRDSRPCNTDLSRVVMTMSYVGAIAYLKSSNAWEDDDWQTYSSSDSIDLRYPMYIKVCATDNTERIYTLKVNCHTVYGDSLDWNTMETEEALSGAYPMKAQAWNGRMLVLVNKGDAVLLLQHDLTNEGEWERKVCDLPVDADVQTLCADDEKLYVSTTNGELLYSADGEAWTLLCSALGLRLTGTSHERLYALYDGGLHSTSAATILWQEEKLDEDASLLPDKDISMTIYSQAKSLTRMVLIGNRSTSSSQENTAEGETAEVNDTSGVVWSKCWTDFETESAEIWMHYIRDKSNTHQLPQFSQPHLLHYDGKLFLAAGESADGKIQALEKFYISEDSGLTWWPEQNVRTPEGMTGSEGWLTVAIDEKKFLWIIAGGKVVRGRINRLGFLRPDVN